MWKVHKTVNLVVDPNFVFKIKIWIFYRMKWWKWLVVYYVKMYCKNFNQLKLVAMCMGRGKYPLASTFLQRRQSFRGHFRDIEIHAWSRSYRQFVRRLRLLARGHQDRTAAFSGPDQAFTSSSDRSSPPAQVVPWVVMGTTDSFDYRRVVSNLYELSNNHSIEKSWDCIANTVEWIFVRLNSKSYRIIYLNNSYNCLFDVIIINYDFFQCMSKKKNWFRHYNILSHIYYLITFFAYQIFKWFAFF